MVQFTQMLKMEVLSMNKSKKYFISYDEYEDGDCSTTIVEDILADPEFQEIDELIIGDWGGSYKNDCQSVIDEIVESSEKFSHITKLFIGDMDYEECEVSWILQGNYDKIWSAMPQLKELTIKGSSTLDLGNVNSEGLESFTIICGGLGADVIKQIENAKLPHLKKLLLYIGVELYGFDGDIDTIKSLLANADFPELEYLGIVDSEIQDEITEAVLASKFINQISTLDLSCGTITDKGGQMIIDKMPDCPNIKTIDLSHNYFSDEMLEKLEKLNVEIDLSDNNVAEEWNGELWYNAMLTE